MNAQRILAALAVSGTLMVGSIALSVPAHATTQALDLPSASTEVAPVWHKVGTYTTLSKCLQEANYYHDFFGTIAERCDLVRGKYELWVLTDL